MFIFQKDPTHETTSGRGIGIIDTFCFVNLITQMAVYYWNGSYKEWLCENSKFLVHVPKKEVILLYPLFF